MESMKKRAGSEGRGALGRLAPRLMLMLGLGLMLMLTPVRMQGQGPTPPDLVAYQGTLVNGDGDPLGTPDPKNYDVVFRVFDASSGGNLVWSEQQTVTVDAGRYSVQLGLGGAVGTEPRPSLARVFRSSTASDRYLEVTVKGTGPGLSDSTLAPRTRMVPGAFAFVSQHALLADRLLNSSNASVITIVETRVGINVTNPVTTLQVSGDIKASGTIRVDGTAKAGRVATARSWSGGGAAPVGSVILWSGTVADQPAGWALCDGSVVNGYKTPDLRGRFVLGSGAGPGLTQRDVGQTGGEETHLLTLAEMGRHQHRTEPVSTVVSDSGKHSHSFSGEAHSNNDKYYLRTWFAATGRDVSAEGNQVSDRRYKLRTGDAWSDHNHAVDLPAVNSTAAGGNLPVDNMPPFYVLAYLVRVD